MKKLFIILTVFLCGFTMNAQDLEVGGNFLSRRYNRITYDTNYIKRPNCSWTFKLRTMMIWQSFETIGEFYEPELGVTSYESELVSALKPKLNIQVGYMGIALAGGISFNKLSGGQDRDFDIKLNMYGKKFGFELGLSGIESLRGNYILDIPNIDGIWIVDYDNNDTLGYVDLPVDMEIPEGKVSQAVFNFNFYYAFNSKKFSYPAAFTQMFLQRKSAGSILAGGEFHVNDIAIGDTLQGDELFHLKNVTYGIGIGYGYNLVLPHRWLIHASVLPYLVLHSKTRVRNYMAEEHVVNAEFPEVFIAARMAIVHDFNARWFAGGTAQLNWSNVNSKKTKTGNSQFQSFIFVGFRL